MEAQAVHRRTERRGAAASGCRRRSARLLAMPALGRVAGLLVPAAAGGGSQLREAGHGTRHSLHLQHCRQQAGIQGERSVAAGAWRMRGTGVRCGFRSAETGAAAPCRPPDSRSLPT
jgi:hypothetical protein